MYHKDNTYKVNKSRFPFLVFGRSDYQGQFHPIAVAVMKIERDDDFSWFLNGIKSFSLQYYNIIIEEKIEHFMIDGCGAEFN